MAMEKEEFMQAYALARAGSGVSLSPQKLAASAAHIFEAIKAEVEGRAGRPIELGRGLRNHLRLMHPRDDGEAS